MFSAGSGHRVIWPLSNWTVKEPEGWTLGGLARYPSEGHRTSGGLATYPSEGRRAGPQVAQAQVRVFSPLADGLSQTMGRRGADVTGGLAGTHSLTNTAGRAAGPHVTALPLERTLLSDKDPPPSGHGSVVPRPRARPHPSRFQQAPCDTLTPLSARTVQTISGRFPKDC